MRWNEAPARYRPLLRPRRLDMSLLTAVRALVAAGATSELILAVVEADHAEREAAIQIKREKDAERQRRHRVSRDVTVTSRDTL